MILWFVVGFVAWALCILFIMGMLKGGSMGALDEEGAEERLRKEIETRGICDSERKKKIYNV